MEAAAAVVLGACGGGAVAAPPAVVENMVPCDVSDRAHALAFYESFTGIDVDDDHFCADVSATFVGWARFGPSWDDHGCAYDPAVYDCGLITASSSARAMADAGYATADPARRLELLVAFLWEISDVLLVTEDRPGDFAEAGQTFTPPSFDGTVLTGWETSRGGWGGVVYTQQRWPVGEDGVPGEPTELARFRVD